MGAGGQKKAAPAKGHFAVQENLLARPTYCLQASIPQWVESVRAGAQGSGTFPTVLLWICWGRTTSPWHSTPPM